MNKVAQITVVGMFNQGINKGKPFLRVVLGGKGNNVMVSENAGKVASAKGYCFINTLTIKDLYPTSNGDSSNVYPDLMPDGTTAHPKAGLPIYTKDEKLTVETYFNRRGQEPRELHSFAGFPTDEECTLIANARVATFTFA